MSCSLLYVITWPIMAGKMRPQGQSYFKLKTILFFIHLNWVAKKIAHHHFSRFPVSVRPLIVDIWRTPLGVYVTPRHRPAAVVCGDLNSLPGSDAYSVLTRTGQKCLSLKTDKVCGEESAELWPHFWDILRVKFIIIIYSRFWTSLMAFSGYRTFRSPGPRAMFSF